MKIRINDNSLRYRLNKQDISVLLEKGNVNSGTQIGLQKLHFCIKQKDIESPRFKLDELGLHLAIPTAQIQTWANTEQVGISFTIINEDQSVLQVLIEKDFECLNHENNENQSFAFENPKKRFKTS